MGGQMFVKVFRELKISYCEIVCVLFCKMRVTNVRYPEHFFSTNFYRKPLNMDPYNLMRSQY